MTKKRFSSNLARVLSASMLHFDTSASTFSLGSLMSAHSCIVTALPSLSAAAVITRLLLASLALISPPLAPSANANTSLVKSLQPSEHFLTDNLAPLAPLSICRTKFWSAAFFSLVVCPPASCQYCVFLLSSHFCTSSAAFSKMGKGSASGSSAFGVGFTPRQKTGFFCERSANTDLGTRSMVIKGYS